MTSIVDTPLLFYHHSLLHVILEHFGTAHMYSSLFATLSLV